MSQNPHELTPYSENRDKMSFPPQVALLNEKQWAYIKKRYRITNRECQIAKLICQCYNNEEIADQLNISLSTVKTHISNIYRKTWVNNKMAMFIRFVDEASYLTPDFQD